MEYSIKVGYSTTRPIAENAFAFVVVEAGSASSAQTDAALMVFALPCPFFGCACVCEMPTSTTIVSVTE